MLQRGLVVASSDFWRVKPSFTVRETHWNCPRSGYIEQFSHCVKVYC
jgi:hypothetical protein